MRLGRRVRRSSSSASVIRRRPALTRSQRSGSGSHRREWCPTQGRRVTGSGRPRTRAASVRPARCGRADAVADVAASPAQAVRAEPDARVPVARDAQRPAPGVREVRLDQGREEVPRGGPQAGEDPVVAVEGGRDPRAPVVGRAPAAEHQPVVGGALAVDDQVAVVGEGLAPGQARRVPEGRRQRPGGHDQRVHGHDRPRRELRGPRLGGPHDAARRHDAPVGHHPARARPSAPWCARRSCAPRRSTARARPRARRAGWIRAQSGVNEAPSTLLRTDQRRGLPCAQELVFRAGPGAAGPGCARARPFRP